MQRTRKYQTALVAAIMAGFAFLPQAYAADTEYETDSVKVEAEGVDKYLVTTNTITAEEIKDRGYRDLADILSQVPGLYMAPADKNSKMVRIRGAEVGQTKVYIDGIPAFPLNGIATNAAADLSTIPADSIAKVEIIKGPGPVQYGTDYKGGVILVTTKDGDGAGKFHLSIAGGSHHTYDTRIGYSGSDKNISYTLNASKRHTGGYLPNAENDKLYFDGKIKFKTSDKSSLILSGYYSDMDSEIPNSVDPVTGKTLLSQVPWPVETGGGITTPMKNNNKTSDWHYKGFKQTNIALQYESRPSDKWMYDIKYYHLIDENNLWVHNLLTSEGGSLPHHTPGAPMWYRSGWFSTGNGIEANASTALGDKHQLSFGAKYVKIDWHTDSNNLSKGDEGTDKRTSFYIEDAWSFDTKTRMTLGVRHESLSQDANNVKSTDRATDPVLNITHDLTKADTLRFSAGRTHVFVQAKSAASNIRANVAVPKPERDRNFELGWKHRFSPKAELDLAVFYTDVTDRIVRFVKGGPFYNIDQTKIRGAELGYQHKFTQKLSAFANYTWMSAEDKSNGKTTDAAGIPHQMINLGLTYREGKWRSTLLGRGVMGWYNGVDGKGKLYPNSSGYFTADLDLRYEPQTDLGVFLRINNIFNRDYQDKLYHPAEGANFLLGVDMTF
ncbi:TonB-dependent receptor [uncultured Selenomonas sp.]|uniref:TonB-dependent receptor n=1 Tax=uncultured Selenomonas sp. TaxID=159275 RepID=UPI0028E6BED3|nr:TonB-dependent receptor [uncultured Selenomonas sp.]